MRMEHLAALPSISELDKAYAAGIIEGEGCIGVYRTTPNISAPDGGYYLTVIVQMKDPQVVLWLADTLGGAVSQPKTEYGGHYKWSVCGLYAGQVLEAIRPFMKLKTAQADLGIAFADTYPQKTVGWLVARTTKPTAEITATRAAICAAFRTLNLRRTRTPKAEISLVERKEA